MTDPAIIGAYGAAFTAVITAIITGFNLSGRLKEERLKREALDKQLDIERKTRLDCMVEVANLRGQVEALTTALRSRGLL